MSGGVLFVAEAVSIAHVARPAVLAQAVAGDTDVAFASSGEYAFCRAGIDAPHHAIHSITPAAFLKRLAGGRPVYDRADWDQYVREDLKLLERVRPKLVVQDFRLSMCVAARQLGIPLWSIANAHWSAFAPRLAPMAPDLPIGRLLGFGFADAAFRAAWPIANKVHVRHANVMRRRAGLTPYRSLAELYCDGDQVLYADSAAVIPLALPPANHRMLGPIVWSPPIPQPPWWAEAAERPRPRVYITLGSTGAADLLPAIVRACLDLGMTCLVATAGRREFAGAPPKVYASDFLPGLEAANMADLVVCNGGSATASQALAAGKPVLGVCSNLDQVLTMQRLSAAGVGRFLRAGEVSPARLAACLTDLAPDSSFAAAAKAAAETYRPDLAPSRFRGWLREALDAR